VIEDVHAVPTMKARSLATLVATLLVALTAVAVELTTQAGPLAPRLGTTPVVVELFTSQGCSSCPPADALIASLAHDESLRGRVIPLAFHVDYWDHLGWRDPFAARAWTIRQMGYVHEMKLNSAYTPQAVIAGQKQFTASNARVMEETIIAASKAPVAGTITVTAKRDAGSVVAEVHAAPPKPDTDIVLVLVQYDVTTQVGGGENGGRVLLNDAIVRSLSRVRSGQTTLKIDPSWKNLGVVAFLQDRETMAITNAAVAKL
jgi:hypothetical protein